MITPAKIWAKIPARLKSKKAALATAAILVLLFFSTRGGGDAEKIKQATVLQKSIESQISVSGTIISETNLSLHFPASGKIEKVAASKSDYVKKDQLIASLDSERFEIALRQAQQDLNLADAVLSQVYDDIKKFSPPENFDRKIKRTNAETAKNKAYDAVLKAQKDLNDTQILAPFDGTITDVNTVVGQEISPQTEIGRISDFKNLNFVAQVDETDIGKANLDQKAKIVLDAFPQETFDARATNISKESITTSTGATAFEVTLKLAARPQFFLGMNGEAQITTESAQNLAIPQEAIVDGNYVWVKTRKTYQKREVTIGISSQTDVEIKAGLSINDRVVTSGFEQINRKSFLQKIIGLWS